MGKRLCHDCDGQGSVSCPRCRLPQCRKCSDSRELTCIYCNGDGVIPDISDSSLGYGDQDTAKSGRDRNRRGFDPSRCHNCDGQGSALCPQCC
jgi:hypothetical protein